MYKLIALFVLCSMLLVACGGERQKSELPALTAPRPEITLPAGQSEITRPNFPQITPGQLPTNLTPIAHVTLPANLPTPGNITRPPLTVANATPLSNYDATKMLTTFANQYLGANVSVTRAGGAKGSVNLPSMQQTQVDAAVSLAGQIAAGVITLNGAQGGAQVAVGSGSISGDLNADISGASLGAYSVVIRAAPPADATAALVLLRQTFPALAQVNLQPQSSAQNSFVFYATTHQGVDWQTKQATAVAEAVYAGTTKQGAMTIVWVAVGNGNFAASLKP